MSNIALIFFPVKNHGLKKIENLKFKIGFVKQRVLIPVKMSPTKIDLNQRAKSCVEKRI